MKKKTNFSLESKIDIKEFKKLKESEKLFRKIFEEASAGIVHVSLNGNFILANQKFCELVGYSRREVLKLTFQDITTRMILNLIWITFKGCLTKKSIHIRWKSGT